MNIIGIEIQLVCERPCCRGVCTIGPGKGPHIGSLRCTDCDRFCGWVSKEVAALLTSIVAILGRPPAEIEVHEVQRSNEQPLPPEREHERRILEVNARIAMGDFEPKDFLTTAPPMRDFWREQQRRKIAQLMWQYGLKAHDLKISELPTDVTQSGDLDDEIPFNEGGEG
jgi:hypothetical protein